MASEFELFNKAKKFREMLKDVEKGDLKLFKTSQEYLLFFEKELKNIISTSKNSENREKALKTLEELQELIKDNAQCIKRNQN